MSYIKVIVLGNNQSDILYQDKYDEIIMIGELIRNLCVNICIDPDTVNGYTNNVNVYINNKKWNYNPHQSLKDLNDSIIKDNQLILTIILKENDTRKGY